MLSRRAPSRTPGPARAQRLPAGGGGCNGFSSRARGFAPPFVPAFPPAPKRAGPRRKSLHAEGASLTVGIIKWSQLFPGGVPHVAPPLLPGRAAGGAHAPV